MNKTTHTNIKENNSRSSSNDVKKKPDEKKDIELQQKTNEEDTIHQLSTGNSFNHDQPDPDNQGNLKVSDSSVQSKLKVGNPGDKYEQEADKTAVEIVTMKEDEIQTKLKNNISLKNTISKTTISHFLQNQKIRPAFNSQTRTGHQNNNSVQPWIEKKISSTKSSGQPLQKNTRNFMENRFNTSFENVRIHKDNSAAQMNQALGSKAFAHKNNIYFNTGNYNPEQNQGKELLAHELTHTIQQNPETIRKEDEDENPVNQPPSPEEKKVITFIFTADKVLPPAEAKIKEAPSIVWSVQKIYNVPEIEAMRIASGWYWDSHFPGVSEGATFYCYVPLKQYIDGLITLYGENDPKVLATLKSYETSMLGGSKIPPEKLTPEYIQNVSEIMKLQSFLSDVEYDFFKKWAKKAGVKVVNLEDATPEELAKIKETLEKFLRNKYELLKEQGLLSEYLQQDDETLESDIQALKDKIFKVDKTLIQEFTDITGISYLELIIPLSPVKKTLDLLDLEKKLNLVGVSTGDLALFQYYFRHKALAKAMKLLAEAEKITEDEKKHYSNETEFDKLVNLLSGKYSEKFTHADKLRLEALKRFRTVYVTKFVSQSSRILSLPQLIPFISIITVIMTSDDDTLLHYISKYPAEDLESMLIIIMTVLDQPAHMLATVMPSMGPIFNKNYPEFSQARQEDESVYKEMRTTDSKEFPILADIFSDFRIISRKPDDKIKEEILTILKEKGENITKTRSKLVDDPELIWELHPLIDMVMNEMMISREDNTGMLAWDKVEDVERSNTIRSIGLGALGIVLGIAGFFTGGSTWAAWGLVGGSALVSGIDLYLELKSYSFHSGAHQATYDFAMTVKPSAFGVAMAILGLAIDVVDVIKHSAKLIRKSAEAISDASKLKNFEEVISDEYDRLVKEKVLPEDVTKAEFALKIREATEFEQKVAKGYPDEFANLLKEHKLSSLPAEHQKQLFKIYDTHQNTCISIVKGLANDPSALIRIAEHVAKDSNITGSFFQIHSVLGDDAVDVFRYLGKEGAGTIDTLPDALAVIVVQKITDKQLIKEVLTNQRLHIGIINAGAKNIDFKSIWDAYKAKKAAGATYSFERYVGFRQIKTTGKVIDEKTIAQELGPAFFSKTLEEQNITLLSRTEPGLAAELQKTITETALPHDLYTKLKSLLNEDIRGTQNIYSKARKGVITKVNEILSSNMKSWEDYTKIMKVTSEPATRGIIGEAAAIKFNIPPGAASGRKITVEGMDSITHPDWPGGRTKVIIDNFISKTRRIGEIKVGTSFDSDQFKRYDFLFQNQSLVKQKLIDAGIKDGKINGISYGLFPNPDDIRTFEAAAAAGKAIDDPVLIRAKGLWDTFVAQSSAVSHLELHFVTVNGRHYKITSSGITWVKKL